MTDVRTAEGDVIEELQRLLARDPDAGPDLLRSRGLLPAIPPGGLPTRALDGIAPVPAGPLVPAAAALLTLDPRKPYVAGKGSLFVSWASGISPAFTPPEVVVWSDGNGFAYLFVFVSGQQPNRGHRVDLTLKIFSPAQNAIHVSATNNPVSFTVTNGQTGNKTVRMPVFLTTRADGTGNVFVSCANADVGFTFHGAELFLA